LKNKNFGKLTKTWNFTQNLNLRKVEKNKIETWEKNNFGQQRVKKIAYF
jgi:hypothetical protein